MKQQINPGVVDLEVKDDNSDLPSPKRRQHRQWGGAFLGLLFGMGGLALGRLGQLYPAFDVFAQFSVQFIFVVFAFSFATFMPKYKALIGVVLFVMMSVAYGAWPIYVSGDVTKGPFPMASGERAIKVAHYNTFVWNNDLAAVTKEIERLDADVVTLIEFDSSKRPVLQSLLRSYPFQYFCDDVPYCHLAIVSKHPILAVSAKGLWEGPAFISAQLGGAMQGLTVYGVHTTRFPRSRAQLKQIRAMVRYLESQSGDMIVMGDFNATPFSRITATLEQGTGLSRVTHMPTWPATYGLPLLAIDHVFVSSKIRVLADQQIGNPAGSDHFPIVMTLGYTPK